MTGNKSASLALALFFFQTSCDNYLLWFSAVRHSFRYIIIFFFIPKFIAFFTFSTNVAV